MSWIADDRCGRAHGGREVMGKMNWPHLRHGDIAGIIVIVIMLAAIVVMGLGFPRLGQKHNFGFGPEWECERMENGDPICVKRPADRPLERLDERADTPHL